MLLAQSWLRCLQEAAACRPDEGLLGRCSSFCRIHEIVGQVIFLLLFAATSLMSECPAKTRDSLTYLSRGLSTTLQLDWCWIIL